MRLSSLQKYILKRCLEQGGKVDRKKFREFYAKQEKVANEKYQESNVTKSMERLIDKGLLIGFGRRTPRKWFITNVKLTRKGREMAKLVLRERQKKLPLR